ncbi:MAG: ammonium transporter [Chloroflexi bacterium]|nr:ammonium transporter [Chloroflexota bacterium]MYE47192.1 ammonium transporter [Chloroflexota bacterium]
MDTGHTAWLLTSTALVLFMTPGLAFFYGGMVRGRNVLAMLMKNYVAMGVVTVTWIVIGYSLAFSGDAGGLGLIGDLEFFALGELGFGTEIGLDDGGDYPDSVFLLFQLMFAIITPALISGAVAERMKFTSWVVFIAIWSIVVYAPMAHWVWGGGFIGSTDTEIPGIGALDFAGGLVVHINAGVAALALVMVLGPRLGWRREVMRPHALPFTVLGAGMLWFGWFGFNAGSALAADGAAGNAFLTTQIAAGVAALAWALAEQVKHGRPTTLGFASGAVAGLVAITPAAGFVSPLWALVIGAAAGVICFLALQIKFRYGFDDSLDVVAVHMIGGIVGALLLGLFAEAAIGGTDGAFFGNVEQLLRQAISIVVALVFSFVVTYVIAVIIDRTMGLRVSEDEERRGLDVSLHEEQGYVLTE